MMRRRGGPGCHSWVRLDDRWGLLGLLLLLVLLLLLLQGLLPVCGRSRATEQLRTHLTASLLHNRLEPRNLGV